jgi:hypothetical protein
MPIADDAAQLRRQLKVVLCPEQIIVSQVRGKPRQTLLQIDAFAIPLSESNNSEAVSGVVWPRSYATSRGLETRFSQEVSDPVRYNDPTTDCTIRLYKKAAVRRGRCDPQTILEVGGQLSPQGLLKWDPSRFCFADFNTEDIFPEVHVSNSQAHSLTNA